MSLLWSYSWRFLAEWSPFSLESYFFGPTWCNQVGESQVYVRVASTQTQSIFSWANFSLLVWVLLDCYLFSWTEFTEKYLPLHSVTPKMLNAHQGSGCSKSLKCGLLISKSWIWLQPGAEPSPVISTSCNQPFDLETADEGPTTPPPTSLQLKGCRSCKGSYFSSSIPK